MAAKGTKSATKGTSLIGRPGKTGGSISPPVGQNGSSATGASKACACGLMGPHTHVAVRNDHDADDY